MSSILIHAWTVYQSVDGYYIPYTHWVYLKEIAKYHDDICLLSPVIKNNSLNKKGLVAISPVLNVTVKELPYSSSYIGSVKYFFRYLSAYKRLKQFDVSYARYPIPFGWLQKIFMRNSKRIIHFVGDPIDTIKVNTNLGMLKKWFLISFFIPEHLMYLWACRKAAVYTNGEHITHRLKKYGVKATPLISSTLNDDDFYFDEYKNLDIKNPKILYVGYLRKTKGVDTVISSFCNLQKKYPDAQLTIVGTGEYQGKLEKLIGVRGIKNVHFLGHIDSREKLNTIFRTHDIFCFASLSEGSPRVILEAMANGINVISTPVGSLPSNFKNNENILFSDFHNATDFSTQMVNLLSNEKRAFLLRKNAFEKVKKYKIDNFLSEIFHET